MTRSEAQAEVKRLQVEHPDRRFVAREATDGGWEVVSVALPEGLRRGPLTASVEARPRPSPADDPRTGNERRLPGMPGGLG